MKILRIAATGLRRTMRERTAVFVVFVLPLLLILLLGLVYGDPAYRLGLVVDEGPLAQELAAGIRDADGLEVSDFADRGALLDAVAHDDRDAGLIIPTGYDARLRAGEQVVIEYLATSDATLFGVAGVIEAQVTAQAARIGAARFAGNTAGVSFEDGMAAAEAVAPSLGGVDVAVVGVGDRELKEIGMFDENAARMLVLFVFLAGLSAGATDLIRSRELGVARRMLATPTSAGTIISGETGSRFLLAFTQSLVIVVVATLAFGVDWGSWPATVAILVTFSLMAAGAGMLLGSLVRSAQLAGNLGVFVALAFAMVGGSIGPGSMPVPHTWANEAFYAVMVNAAGIVDIAPELGVLALYAFAFIALASMAFRRWMGRGLV